MMECRCRRRKPIAVSISEVNSQTLIQARRPKWKREAIPRRRPQVVFLECDIHDPAQSHKAVILASLKKKDLEASSLLRTAPILNSGTYASNRTKCAGN
jgi:hypothetical protein